MVLSNCKTVYSSLPRRCWVMYYLKAVFHVLFSNWLIFQSVSSATFGIAMKTLLPSDQSNNIKFGWSVNIDGRNSIIGGQSELEQSSIMFYNLQESWKPFALDTTSNLTSVNFNGQSSISRDYAIVGSPPFAMILVKSDAIGWTGMTRLTTSDGSAGDSFGMSVTISGNYAVVGAPLKDIRMKGSDLKPHQGSVYVFHKNNSNWNQQAKIIATDGEAYDEFGCSLSLSSGYLVIGAYHDETCNYQTCHLQGSVYIYLRDGSVWVEETKLLPQYDGDGEFGHAVSIDGLFVIIGSHLDGDNDHGSAYIYKRSGSDWRLFQQLTANDADALDQFGWSVSISGNYAMIGAFGDDNHQGSAYIFQRSFDTWHQQAKLIGSAVDDYFGWSVSIDGNYALVGSPQWNDNKSSGYAVIYARQGTSWVLAQEEEVPEHDEQLVVEVLVVLM